MTQQKAKVIRILEGSRAEVAVKRQSACGHDCSKCGGGCSELMVEPEVRVVADNFAGAHIGDTVTVESATSGVLGAAFLVYIVPLLLFFVGYLTVGLVFQGSEGISIIAGISGFMFGFLLAWLWDRQLRQKRAITFRITIIEQGN